MAGDSISSLDSRGRDFIVKFNSVRHYKWINNRRRLNFVMIMYPGSLGHLPGADYGAD